MNPNIIKPPTPVSREMDLSKGLSEGLFSSRVSDPKEIIDTSMTAIVGYVLLERKETGVLPLGLNLALFNKMYETSRDLNYSRAHLYKGDNGVAFVKQRTENTSTTIALTGLDKRPSARQLKVIIQTDSLGEVYLLEIQRTRKGITIDYNTF